MLARFKGSVCSGSETVTGTESHFVSDYALKSGVPSVNKQKCPTYACSWIFFSSPLPLNDHVIFKNTSYKCVFCFWDLQLLNYCINYCYIQNPWLVNGNSVCILENRSLGPEENKGGYFMKLLLEILFYRQTFLAKNILSGSEITSTAKRC